jgi:hypothetical protein
MKRFTVAFLIAALLLIACESNRPNGNGTFTVSLEGHSILKTATVAVLKGEEELASTTTDEAGLFEVKDLATSATLTVKVCGGTFFSAATETDIANNGCLAAKVLVTQSGKEIVYIDWISALAFAYESDTARDEVLAYLQLDKQADTKLEATLTDSTKIYLWQQAFALVAKDISVANSVTPETSLGTEALFAALLADLIDNNIIDGSTDAKFGPILPVDEYILRQLIPAALSKVSANFTEADLGTWSNHLAVTPAKFLAGGEADDSDILNDGEETDEDSLYPDFDTVGNPPGIEIKTPANSAVLYNTVTVKAQRTLESCPLIALSCTVKNGDATYTKELTDTNSNAEVFEGTLDTIAEEIADGEYTLTCTGSNGIKPAAKSLKFTLANHNPVTVLPYVTDKITGVTGVAVYDAEGTKVKTLTETAGTVSGDLPPGEYTFAVNGGDYTSILFTSGTGDPKVVTLSTPLLSRAVVAAGENTAVYITPLTTIREIIYQGLMEKGGRTLDKAIDDSLALFETHYLDGMNPYVKPVAGQPAENATATWSAIAALEQLAADIAADKGLSSGAVLMDDILVALAADLVEEKGLFDGRDLNDDSLTIKTFAVDSYLFRYHYAVALKRFIETETEYTYQDFQTLISKISMDTSELFPADKAPIEVVAQPPEITNLSFKRSIDAGFIDYVEPSTIPYVSSSLDLRFFVEHGTTATIDMLDLYFVEGTPVKRIGDLADVSGTYTASSIMVEGEDGPKTLTIRAEDDQHNYGTRTVNIVKDSVSPTVELTPPAAEVIAGDISFDYSVTEERLDKEYYTIQPQGGTLTTHPIGTPNLSGNISLSDLADDGTYTVTFYAADKAGNSGDDTFTRTKDSTPPSATIAVNTVEASPREVPTATGWININDFSIAFSGVADRPGSNITYRYTVATGGAAQNATNTTTVSTWASTQYLTDLADSVSADLLNTKHVITAWVKDDVGNESQHQNAEVYVDTVTPTLSVSDSPGDPVNAWTYTYTATDTNMKRVWITDEVGIQTIVTEGSSGTRNYSLDCINGAAEGIHVVTFRAEDEAGNKAPDVVKNIRIDCTSPILNGGADPYLGTNLEETGRYLKQTDSIVLSLNEPGTIYYEYFLSSNPYLACSDSASYTDTSKVVSCPFDGEGATDGVYTIKLYAFDLAGNKSAEFIRTFTIDNIIPAFTVTTASKATPWNQYTATSATTVNYTATDTNLSECVFRLNGTDISTITYDTSLGGSGSPVVANNNLSINLKYVSVTYFDKDGTNVVTADCSDLAGNAQSKTFSWFFDSLPPAVSLLTMTPTLAQSDGNYYSNASSYSYTLKIADAAPGNLFNKVYCKWKYEQISNGYQSSWANCSTASLTPNSAGEATFTLAFSTEGRIYSIMFYADDAALNSGTGNSDYTLYSSFIIDKTGPAYSYGGVEGYIGYSYFFWYITPTEAVTDCEAYFDNVPSYTDNNSNGTPDAGEWWCEYDDANPDIPILWVVAASNSGTHTIKGCSKDWLGNNTCVTKTVNFSAPSLHVNFLENTNTYTKFQILTDAGVNVDACEVWSTSPATKKGDCPKSTAIQTYSVSNTTTYPDGDYYVKVNVTRTADSATNTGNFAFNIDRRPTTVTVAPACNTYVGGQCPSYYYGTTPKMQYSASMARGVSRVKLWLKDRIIHIQHPHDGTYTCAAKTCTKNTYNLPILDSTNSSGIFSIPSTMIGGKYTVVSYEVTSTTGEVATGTVDLAPQIRYLKNADDKFKVTNAVRLGSSAKFTIREPIIPDTYSLGYGFTGTNGYDRMGYYNSKYWYYKVGDNATPPSCTYTTSYELTCVKPQPYYHYRGGAESGSMDYWDPLFQEATTDQACTTNGDCLEGLCVTHDTFSKHCHRNPAIGSSQFFFPYESKINVTVTDKAYFNFTIPLSSYYGTIPYVIRKQADSPYYIL